MNIFFNMDRTDFINQLRYGAIKSGGSPQLIDQIDSLFEMTTEEEIEEREESAYASGEVDGAKDMWKDCYDRLDAKLDRDGPIGLTEMQILQIKQLLMDIKP